MKDNMCCKISIIILNWNGWEDTIECLESLYQINYLNYEVIIVDNNSKNDSIKKIRQYCSGKLKPESKFFKYKPNNKPIKITEYTEEKAESKNPKKYLNVPSNKKLTLIKNNQNYGFAEGNNIGIRYALKNQNPDHILLLNNDTVVEKNFLTEMVNVLINDDKIGFVGPKTYYYDFKGKKNVLNFAGGKINLWKGKTYHIGITELDIGQYDKTKEVDYVEGSCFLVKKEVLNKVGLLDSTFFAYWEENDLCIRASKQEYKCFFVPNAMIWHKISLSSTSDTKIYYMTRNRFFFMQKNVKKVKYFMFLLYFFIIEFVVSTGICIIFHKSIKEYKCFLKGIKDGLFTK